jgi:hypothetical protein
MIVLLAGVSVQAQKSGKGPISPIIINHSITVQDEGSGSYLVFDPNSGEYKFRRCKDDFEMAGFGLVKVDGCSITFEDMQLDHRVLASTNECTQEAKAFVEVFADLPFGTEPVKEVLDDRDMRDNTLNCVVDGK